jgi:hypothetical protein
MLTQDAFSAFNDGGTEAVLDYFRLDVELVAPPDWPDEPVLNGHAGVRQLIDGFDEQFDGFRLDLARTVDAGGDGVLALYKEIVQPSALCLEFIEGKVSRWHACLSWEQALEAVGLEE